MIGNSEKGQRELFDFLDTQSKLFGEIEFPFQVWQERKERKIRRRSIFYSALAVATFLIVFSLPALGGISLSGRIEKRLQGVNAEAKIESGLRTAFTIMKEYW